MKTLAEIAEEAYLEGLQLAWDKHLVHGWFNYSKCSMRMCAAEFFRDNFQALTNEKAKEYFHKLKRTPQFKHHWHSCVSRFIAAYLPRLNTVLWAGKLSEDAVVARLNASGLTTNDKPSNHAAYRRDKAEQNNAERAERAYTSLRRLRSDARDATSKSNWKTCK